MKLDTRDEYVRTLKAQKTAGYHPLFCDWAGAGEYGFDYFYGEVRLVKEAAK